MSRAIPKPLPPGRASIPVLTPLTRPRLLLRPLAFLKLTYLCQAASTEVGGFGLGSEADPLVIDDLRLVRQEATAVTVVFDDDAVADLIDDMADAGVPPRRCGRVWVHTHPGQSASPSGTDERTFARCFGGADFSVMLILARGGDFYARLQMVGGINAAVEIPVAVDWPSLPRWLDEHADVLPGLVRQWRAELATLVSVPTARAMEGRAFAGDLRLEAADDDAVPYRGWWQDEAYLASIDEDEEVGLDHDLT